jgi:hypothetical protein
MRNEHLSGQAEEELAKITQSARDTAKHLANKML